MFSRTRLVTAAAAVGLVLTGLTVVPFSAAQAGPAPRCKTAVVPKPITSGQTSSSQAQVRWAAGANVTKYRLHWSPAPFGKWPGFNPYTPWVGKAARFTAINLPAVGSGDRFMNARYGNPVFAQMQVYNACNKSVRQGTFVPVWPKAPSPGSAATGDALAVGSYNLEKFPTYSGATRTKLTNIASNIASKNLDVVALQEANSDTAKDLVTRLAREFGQNDWEAATAGNTRGIAQQIIYRSGRFSQEASGVIGQAKDKSASTPLLTPWVRLLPVGAGPTNQGLFVVSAHLEDAGGSIQVKKRGAHNAALALLRSIATVNKAGLPSVVAGDLRGNFNAWCDEKSKPACIGEGQPTFIRNGYSDAQGAVKKVNIQYATVNKHDATQPANLSGFGGRADYILMKGFTGSARYEVVKRGWGNGSAAYQPDHNLITANLFIPFKK